LIQINITNSKQKDARKMESFQLLGIIKKNIVPILFAILCLVGSFYAKLPLNFLLNDIIIRMARNSFLVLSLVIPVIAGLDLILE